MPQASFFQFECHPRPEDALVEGGQPVEVGGDERQVVDVIEQQHFASRFEEGIRPSASYDVIDDSDSMAVFILGGKEYASRSIPIHIEGLQAVRVRDILEHIFNGIETEVRRASTDRCTRAWCWCGNSRASRDNRHHCG